MQRISDLKKQHTLIKYMLGNKLNQKGSPFT